MTVRTNAGLKALHAVGPRHRRHHFLDHQGRPRRHHHRQRPRPRQRRCRPPQHPGHGRTERPPVQVVSSSGSTLGLADVDGVTGIDTTNFNTFTSGSLQKVTLGTSITGVQDFQLRGGDIKTVDTTTVHDLQDTQIVVGANAMSADNTMQWDPVSAAQRAMIAAFQTRGPTRVQNPLAGRRLRAVVRHRWLYRGTRRRQAGRHHGAGQDHHAWCPHHLRRLTMAIDRARYDRAREGRVQVGRFTFVFRRPSPLQKSPKIGLVRSPLRPWLRRGFVSGWEGVKGIRPAAGRRPRRSRLRSGPVLGLVTGPTRLLGSAHQCRHRRLQPLRGSRADRGKRLTSWLATLGRPGLNPTPPPPECRLSIEAWNLLGGLDWQGIDWVVDYLGIPDRNALVLDLITCGITKMTAKSEIVVSARDETRRPLAQSRLACKSSPAPTSISPPTSRTSPWRRPRWPA